MSAFKSGEEDARSGKESNAPSHTFVHGIVDTLSGQDTKGEIAKAAAEYEAGYVAGSAQRAADSQTKK